MFRFRSRRRQITLELCRTITARHFCKDEAVFEQGQHGSTFYIIYSGAVRVFVSDANATGAGASAGAVPSVGATAAPRFRGTMGQAPGTAPTAEPGPASRTPTRRRLPGAEPDPSEHEAFGTCVCVLEDGDSFGELALLGNGKRAATVLPAMDTILLRVEKEA